MIENLIMKTIEKEKAELIKKSLLLIEDFANIDIDELNDNNFDLDELKLLIKKAKLITRNVHWKLK